MESTRNIRRMIDKEIKKGSAPLAFEHIDYRPDAIQEITSESKLKEVLVYLLRIAEYENLANDMTRNNVYTENHLLRGDSFHRRNNVMERNANYLNAITYAKRLKPVYEGKTFVETVPCFFSFPEAELDRYRFVYEGTETYAFPMSGKHIINGLYLLSIMNRKDLAFRDVPYYIDGDINKQMGRYRIKLYQGMYSLSFSGIFYHGLRCDICSPGQHRYGGFKPALSFVAGNGLYRGAVLHPV